MGPGKPYAAPPPRCVVRTRRQAGPVNSLRRVMVSLSKVPCAAGNGAAESSEALVPRTRGFGENGVLGP
jgi:hypothetical protein